MYFIFINIENKQYLFAVKSLGSAKTSASVR